MVRNKQLTWTRTAFLVAFTTGVAVGGLASAAKPGSGGGDGGGTVPPGKIYFHRVEFGEHWKMNGDGSGKEYSEPGEPTHQPHDGARWFLTALPTDGTDPDGTRHAEIFATTEGGNPLQLTSDPNVEPAGCHRWAKDDSFISYTAIVYDPAGDYAGLFVAEVDWSLGLPVIGPPQRVLEATLYDEVYPDILAHDWSPLGDEMIYMHDVRDSTNNSTYWLNVTRFLADGTTETRTLGEGRNPEWSPDGGRIAFDIGEIWTILPDGTGAVQLTKASLGGGGEKQQHAPTWSPDGKHLAFTEYGSTQKGFEPTQYSNSILRIPAGGGKATSLTGDIGNSGGPKWRP